mgnify:CR=1 FL=1
MAHSLYKLTYHCVFSTNGRYPFLKPDILPRVHGYIRGIVREIDGSLLAIGGTNDHVHLLMTLPGNLSVADAMRLIKTKSSKWIHETFPDQLSFAWQTGYAAFSVSESAVPSVTNYIRDQVAHHTARSFDEEIRLLAERHGIAFDPRFLEP